MAEYFSPKSLTENLTVIERSKFICVLCPVENEEDAKSIIESVSKKHPFASHNCYAYISDEKGLNMKFSDDGEPQGTAGQPMLEVLKAKKLYKTLVVVTRYFGGVKLGAGGLVRAYSGAVSSLVENSNIVRFITSVKFFAKISYEDYPKILNFFRINNDIVCKIVKQEFLDNVQIEFIVSKNDCERLSVKLTDYFCGQLSIENMGEGYFAF